MSLHYGGRKTQLGAEFSGVHGGKVVLEVFLAERNGGISFDKRSLLSERAAINFVRATRIQHQLVPGGVPPGGSSFSFGTAGFGRDLEPDFQTE